MGTELNENMEIQAWILNAFINSKFASQTEAAIAIGKSQSFISQAVNGQSPKMENAIKEFSKAGYLPEQFVFDITMKAKAKEHKIIDLQDRLLKALDENKALLDREKHLQNENQNLWKRLNGKEK